ncbi:MAG: hypothetical protein IJS96_06955 [Schwartzia sp.]|nr:hypothetical protein [Schwartzia sp. (in: firmicutes)]
MGGRGSNFSGGGGSFADALQGKGGTPGKAHPIDINKFPGMTIQQAEERARKLGHEELFVFDEKGKLVAGYKGGKDSVAFPTSELSRKGATVTHGHPKGAEDFGGTLSFADVGNMLRSNWSEHRATASGQGEMNYIMRRTNKADSAGLMQRMLKDANGLEAQVKSEARKARKRALSTGKTPQQAEHEARQKGVGVLNRYYKDTMPKYGFEYVTRKNPYPYQR